MILQIYESLLKGQCHEIFDHFFAQKIYGYEQTKMVSQNFLFSQR